VVRKIIIIIRNIAKLFGILIIRDTPSNTPQKQLSTVLKILKINVVTLEQIRHVS
jgi:hypothetical protein